MSSNSSGGDYSRNLCIILGATLGLLTIAIVVAAVHVYIKDHPRRKRGRSGSLWRTVTPVDDAEIETWRRPMGQIRYDEKGFRPQEQYRNQHHYPQQQPTLPPVRPARPETVRTPMSMSGTPWAPWAEPDENYYAGEHQPPQFSRDSVRASSRYSQPSQYSEVSRYSQPTDLTLAESDIGDRLSTIYSGPVSPSMSPYATSPRGLVIRTPSPVSPSNGRYHVRSQASDFDFGFQERELEKDGFGDSPKSVSTAGSSRHLSSHLISGRY